MESLELDWHSKKKKFTEEVFCRQNQCLKGDLDAKNHPWCRLGKGAILTTIQRLKGRLGLEKKKTNSSTGM